MLTITHQGSDAISGSLHINGQTIPFQNVPCRLDLSSEAPDPMRGFIDEHLVFKPGSAVAVLEFNMRYRSYIKRYETDRKIGALRGEAGLSATCQRNGLRCISGLAWKGEAMLNTSSPMAKTSHNPMADFIRVELEASPGSRIMVDEFSAKFLEWAGRTWTNNMIGRMRNWAGLRSKQVLIEGVTHRVIEGYRWRISDGPPPRGSYGDQLREFIDSEMEEATGSSVRADEFAERFRQWRGAWTSDKMVAMMRNALGILARPVAGRRIIPGYRWK